MRVHTYVGRILTARSGDRHISAHFLKANITQPGLSSSTKHDSKGNIDAFLRDIQNNLVSLPVGRPLDAPIHHIIESKGFSIFWTINTHPQSRPYFNSLGLDHGSKAHAFVAVSISLEHLHERSEAFEFFYDGLNVATVLALVGSRWIKACLIVLSMAARQKPTFHSVLLC